MKPDMVNIGGLQVSRFIIGGNPFSGFSHQSGATDKAQMRYHNVANIKKTLREAEELGVNTHISRADHHVMRYLMEYWDEGGSINWFAQTCPGVGPISMGVSNAVGGGAKGVHIHGGVMDHLLAQDKFDEAVDGVKMIHDAGLVAGCAGHNPEVFAKAEEVGLEVDYYMCCYYNPTCRDDDPVHPRGATEMFHPYHRERMATYIKGLSKPVVHYKVLAAGRTDPAEAFEFVANTMRENDVACVGIYTENKPDMIKEDVDLLMASVQKQKWFKG